MTSFFLNSRTGVRGSSASGSSSPRENVVTFVAIEDMPYPSFRLSAAGPGAPEGDQVWCTSRCKSRFALGKDALILEPVSARVLSADLAGCLAILIAAQS